MIDREKLQIEILLQEYASSHDTRNHYDNVQWIIGSIFIGASLTLFGLSLNTGLVEVILSFLFSLSSILIWFLYTSHVNNYITASIIRCHEIEDYLRKEYAFEIKLHKSIWKMEYFPKIRGITITFSLISLITFFWLLRTMWSIYALYQGLASEFVFWFVISVFAYFGFIYVFWNLQKKFYLIDLNKKL
jgi:hypothetical protein